MQGKSLPRVSELPQGCVLDEKVLPLGLGGLPTRKAGERSTSVAAEGSPENRERREDDVNTVSN